MNWMEQALPVFGVIAGVVLGYFLSRSRELEKEAAAKVKEHYSLFICNLFAEMEKMLKEISAVSNQPVPPKKLEQLKKIMADFYPKLLMYGTPATIKQYARIKNTLLSGSPETLREFIRFVKFMRADLGLSNQGIDEKLLQGILLNTDEKV